MKLVVLAVAASACGPSGHAVSGPTGGSAGPATGAALLPALPASVPVNTKRFTSIVVCDRCHTAGNGDNHATMRDSHGVDISPVTEIRAGMMSLAARDPYFLAALRRELDANPEGKRAIEDTCLRCHAPVGHAESGGAITLDDITTSTSKAAALAREGVACIGCHGLSPDKLGDDSTFTGKHVLRDDRVSYGILRDPKAEAMVLMSKTTPVTSAHVEESRLCASCHTVLVRALDPSGAPTGDEIHEQTTFLEWRDSAYVDGGERAKTCQGCHMPRTEDELGNGPDLETPFATRPTDAPVRQGYRRHALRGGNSYLLGRLADHADWLNADAKPIQLRAAAAATDRFLSSAAELLVETTTPRIKLTISNRTGHKLPTGYPTRRMWLHVVARSAAGAVVFESGAHRDGALIDSRGHRIDGPGVILPHRTELTSPDQVIVWEQVPVDAAGKRTHLLLGTAKVVKDDRILPIGWKPDHPDAARTLPIGVEADPDFSPGQDTVEIDVPKTATTVTFELLYQPIPPETFDSYQPTDSKEAARFLAVADKPPVPVVLATKTVKLER